MDMREGSFQPARFERYVPVMAMEQRAELLFAVPYLCQYKNCSVVVVLVEHPYGGLLHAPCSLTIGGQDGVVVGGGTDQEHRYRFLIKSRIPDEQAARLPMTFHVDLGKPATMPKRAIREGSFKPDWFERYVPVMAMVQQEDLLVTVPYLCQYNNCSVVSVLLEHAPGGLAFSNCYLTMANHEVRGLAGVAGRQEARFRFAVIPPIPDEQAPKLPMIVHIEPRTPPQIPNIEPFTPVTPTTIEFHSRSVGGG